MKTGLDEDVAIEEDELKNDWLLSLHDEKLNSMKTLSFKMRY